MANNAVGYVLGNGPSGKDVQTDKGTWYGCNMAGAERGCTYVFCADPWGQYNIIRSKYKGKCKFVGLETIPIEIGIEELIPAGYDYVVHNMEQKADSSAWTFYATGNTDVEGQFGKNDYWAQERAYVCYIPEYMDIEVIEKMAINVPSGGYALKYALTHHTKVEVYGFDCMTTGSYSGSWDLRGEPHKPGFHFDKQSWQSSYGAIIGKEKNKVIWR